MKRLFATASIAIALLAACSADDPSTPTSTPRVSASPEPTLDPPETSIEVEVKDGEVVGGVQRSSIELGERIGISVISDVDDHVRIEGETDRHPIDAGGGIYVRFEPAERGNFEVQMIDAGITIAEIEVT